MAISQESQQRLREAGERRAYGRGRGDLREHVENSSKFRTKPAVKEAMRTLRK
jgi:hypothetical protein